MINKRLVALTVASLFFTSLTTTAVLAGPYSDAVLADSPLAYYRLDETTLGTAANVGSATGIDATHLNYGTGTGPGNIGQPGPRPNEIAGGFVIDGFENDNRSIYSVSDDSEDFPIVSVADFPSNPLDVTGALTMEAWVFRDAQSDGGGNNEGIISKYWGGALGNERSFVMFYDPTPGNVGIALSDSGSFNSAFNLTTSIDIPLGEWTHLAATVDPSTRSAIYINGQLAAEQTNPANVPASIFDGAADLWIGKQFSTAANTSFEGRIDEVSIYNSALSAVQITNHFEAATSDEAPLSFSWNLNSSGDWNDSANWTFSTVPNNNERSAVFGSSINTPRVVYTDSAVTIKGLQFANANTYAIAGTGGINLEADSGNSTVEVLLGEHEIQTAVTLNNDADFSGSGGVVNFNNVLDIAGNTLTIQSGAYSINHSVVATAGGMIDNAGTLGTAGSTTFGSDLTSTGTLDIDIAGTGTDEFDAFNVAGTATISGLIDTELLGDFTLAGDETFTILTANTLVAGSIALTGSAASMFQLSVESNSLVLNAVMGIPGDFDGDGNVDGADFLEWQRGLGTTYDANDLTDWQTNYGMSASLATSVAVPEPTTLAILLSMAMVWFGGLRMSKARVTAIAGFCIISTASTAAQAQYSAAVLADNPVAYYRLDETADFFAANSGSGGGALEGLFNQLNQGSGPGNIGQLGPRPGDIAGGFLIDGLEANNNSVHIAPLEGGVDFSSVVVNDNALLDITGALTLEAWVNRDEQTDAAFNEGIIAKYLGEGNARAYDLYYSPAAGEIGFAVSPDGTFPSSDTLTTDTDIALNEWVHVAATFVPSTSMSIYINGELAATQPTTIASIFDSPADLWIGQQFNTTPNATFEGRIDEAAIYDRALSGAEILEHFEAATGSAVAAYNWNVDSSGDWKSLANWSPASVPNTDFAVVNFGNAITSAHVVYAETDITAKSVNFDNANTYAIAGVASLILAADTGNASIDVTQGDHELQIAVQLDADVNVNVASGSLSFNNVIDLNGNTLNIQSGTVDIANQVLPGDGGTISNSATLLVSGATSMGGDFTNDGELAIGIGGSDSGSLEIGGTATLAGVLSPELLAGVTLSEGETFEVLTAGTLVDNGITLAGDLASSFELQVVGNSLVITSTVPEAATLALVLVATQLLLCSRRRSF